MERQATSPAYDRTFENFETPLMRKFRELAYGRDIGQHSWTTVHELQDVCSLIKPDSHVVDVGCGPGGPLTYIAENVGCRGVGLDISEAAIRIARGRAEQMGVSKRITFIQADCDEPLPLSSRSFDVAVSVDVILHLRDRRIFLDRVSQLLKPGASLFFTDAGVMTGAMTDAERELRTLYGYTQFVPEGVNEECIAKAGLLLQNRTDSTELLIATASSRLQARLVLSQEFISFEGQDHFQRQNTYLETIIDLAQRRILSRFTYASSARC